MLSNCVLPCAVVRAKVKDVRVLALAFAVVRKKRFKPVTEGEPFLAALAVAVPEQVFSGQVVAHFQVEDLLETKPAPVSDLAEWSHLVAALQDGLDRFHGISLREAALFAGVGHTTLQGVSFEEFDPDRPVGEGGDPFQLTPHGFYRSPKPQAMHLVPVGQAGGQRGERGIFAQLQDGPGVEGLRVLPVAQKGSSLDLILSAGEVLVEYNVQGWVAADPWSYDQGRPEQLGLPARLERLADAAGRATVGDLPANIAAGVADFADGWHLVGKYARNLLNRNTDGEGQILPPLKYATALQAVPLISNDLRPCRGLRMP